MRPIPDSFWHLLTALVILLSASQCSAPRAHAATGVLPSHYFVYELVLKMNRQHCSEMTCSVISERVSTGTAYRTEALCLEAAAEENKRTNTAVHFQCEPLIVLKE